MGPLFYPESLISFHCTSMVKNTALPQFSIMNNDSTKEHGRLSEECLNLKVELFRQRRSIIRLRRKTLDLKPHCDGKYVCNPADIQALMDAQDKFCDTRAELLSRKIAKSLQPRRPGSIIPRRMTISHVCEEHRCPKRSPGGSN